MSGDAHADPGREERGAEGGAPTLVFAPAVGCVAWVAAMFVDTWLSGGLDAAVRGIPADLYAAALVGLPVAYLTAIVLVGPAWSVAVIVASDTRSVAFLVWVGAAAGACAFFARGPDVAFLDLAPTVLAAGAVAGVVHALGIPRREGSAGRRGVRS